MNDEVLALVKQRLSIDDSQDALISSYVDEIGFRIVNTCNFADVSEIPDGLKFTWASMVIDTVKIELKHLSSFEAVAAVPDVKIGDTSVMSAKTVDLSSGKSVIDAVVLNYRVDLNRYRKLRW